MSFPSIPLHTDTETEELIACPRCEGLGVEDGCIGEGLCSLCLGEKVVAKNMLKDEYAPIAYEEL